MLDTMLTHNAGAKLIVATVVTSSLAGAAVTVVVHSCNCAVLQVGSIGTPSGLVKLPPIEPLNGTIVLPLSSVRPLRSNEVVCNTVLPFASVGVGVVSEVVVSSAVFVVASLSDVVVAPSTVVVVAPSTVVVLPPFAVLVVAPSAVVVVAPFAVVVVADVAVVVSATELVEPATIVVVVGDGATVVVVVGDGATVVVVVGDGATVVVVV